MAPDVAEERRDADQVGQDVGEMLMMSLVMIHNWRMMKLVMRGWPTANFSLGVIGVRQQLSRSGNFFLALLVHRPR